jgi:hypothetical protein
MRESFEKKKKGDFAKSNMKNTCSSRAFLYVPDVTGLEKISKSEGRVLYPRENIKDKINTKCLVCKGKKVR